jgi:polysaccharide pyruvyl transferase WcaK-like protein
MPEAELVGVANSPRELADDDVPLSHSVSRYLAGGEDDVLRFLPRSTAQLVRCALLLVNARRVAAGKPTVLLSRMGRSALEELQAADALFLSGAGTMNDRYARSVGGLWCLLIRVMSIMGKPVVASGQQVGPLSQFLARLIVRWGLRTIDVLGVREPESFRYAVRIGVPRERVVLTGDDAWNLRPAPASLARSILARHGVEGPFIAAQVRFGPSTGWRDEDAASLGEVLSRLSEHSALPVVFVLLSHSKGRNEDEEAAERVSRHMRTPPRMLSEHLDGPTTKALLGEASLGVGISYHFCVFAVSMGTPVIGMHSSPYIRHKMQGLAALESKHFVALPRERTRRPESLLGVMSGLLDSDRRHATEGDSSEVLTMPDEVIHRLRTMLPSERGGLSGRRC